MSNLKIAMDDAKSHFEQYKRNTIIFVPKALADDAFQLFNEENDKKDHIIRSKDNKTTLQLAVGEINGNGMPHFETMFVINPQEMEDRVLNELKAVPDSTKTTTPMIFCVRI